MGQFLHNMKGGITVAITLLFLPSLLVTGAGVDVARIYSASSVMENANQLTANAILTQYDGLLQDLYGIYAIDDQLLTTMVDDYIDAYFLPSIYGTDDAQGLGTFQLFYGTADAEITANQTLIQGEDASVLRRQIEEYAKYSVPIELYPRILELMDTVAQLGQDTLLVREKLNLDQESLSLLAEYEALYGTLLETQTHVEELKQLYIDATEYQEWLLEYQDELDSYSQIEDYVDEVLDRAITIHEEELGEEVAQVVDEYLEIVWEEIEQAREAYEKALANMEEGDDPPDPVDEEAIWLRLLPTLMDDLTHDTESVVPCYLAWLEDEYSVAFDALEEASAALPINSFSQKLEALQSMLGQSGYDQNLVLGLTTASSSGSVSAVDAYTSLTIYDIVNATDSYVSANGGITDPVVDYGAASSESEALNSFLFCQFDPQEGEKFQYDTLVATVNLALSQMELQCDALFGMEGISPEGALYHTSLQSVANPSATWSVTTLPDMVQGTTLQAIDSNFTDNLLTLGYGTYMFSNYATQQGETALNGVTFGTDINYFYQSELEYMLLGYDNAVANVAEVMQDVFSVRMVANYCAAYEFFASSFAQTTSSYGLSGIYAHLGQSSLLGLYTTGQSAVDMENMLEGQEVAAYHETTETWLFTPISGSTNTSADVVAALTTVDMNEFWGKSTSLSTEFTMDYLDYLIVFLLQVDADTLGTRIIDLISCNLTNTVYGLNGNETQMGTVERHDIGNYVTGIQIDTTAQVNMLFLSMGNFESLSSGFSPVSSKTILVSDIRGY